MVVKMKQVAFNSDGTPLDEEAKAAIEQMTEEMGFPPSVLIAIQKAMPDKMNVSGLITIILNMMATYDMFDKTGFFMSELMQAFIDLKKNNPDFFEEGGVERARASGDKDLAVKAGFRLN